VVHAIGSASAIYAHFGVSAGTGQTHSKTVRKLPLEIQLEACAKGLISPARRRSGIQRLDQRVQIGSNLIGHVLEDLPECAYTQRFMGGDGEVLLPVRQHASESHVAATLSGHGIAKSG
jgi:hypothetical protein